MKRVARTQKGDYVSKTSRALCEKQKTAKQIANTDMAKPNPPAKKPVAPKSRPTSPARVLTSLAPAEEIPAEKLRTYNAPATLRLKDLALAGNQVAGEVTGFSRAVSRKGTEARALTVHLRHEHGQSFGVPLFGALEATLRAAAGIQGGESTDAETFAPAIGQRVLIVGAAVTVDGRTKNRCEVYSVTE